MSFDWAADVRKYAPDADDGVIAAIVRYCEAERQPRDGVLPPLSDLTETAVVRERFLKHKLGMDWPDIQFDRLIGEARRRMGDEPLCNPVTLYYLLAERLFRLSVFATPPPVQAEPHHADLTVVPDHDKDEIPDAEAMHEHVDEHPTVPNGAVGQVDAAPRRGWGLLPWLVLGLVLLALLLWMVGCQSRRALPVPGPAVPPAAAASTPATVPATPVPEAGVVSAMRDGKPLIKVYFRSGSAWLVPAVHRAAQTLKAYAVDHGGTTFAVTGFADRSGSTDINAAIAKERASRVKAALVAAGIPDASVVLVKPADVVDAGAAIGAARRVEVSVQ